MTVRIVNGQLTIHDADRFVIAAPGNVIPLLPSAYDLEISNLDLDYPDPPADYAYGHQWGSAYDSGSGLYGLQNRCRVGFTRLPQEWSQPQVIGTAPVGATFLVVRLLIQRTIAPSHPWNGQTLIPRPPENLEVPFAGSILLEAVLGISRLLHVTLNPATRQVILTREQTVSTAAGGYGTFGAGAPVMLSDSQGGSLSYGSAPGQLVYSPGVNPYFKTTGPIPATYTNYFDPTGPLGNHMIDGIDPGSLSDPTNYAARYRISARIQFGKD